MSSFKIFPYPVLTESLYRKLGYTLGEILLSYKDSDGVHNLKSESEEGATSTTTLVRVGDENGIWHPDNFGLDIEFSGEIENPAFLFGNGGLLPRENSVLGIGLIWTDREARIRGGLPLTKINADIRTPFEYNAAVHFDSGELRGILSLKTVLFVSESSGTDENGHIFASSEGTILGTLDDIRLVIEGNGSVFPISEVEEPGEPLWWIETSIDDPNTDRFDGDHISLILNRAHKNFPDLHLGDDEDSYLLKEVIASALFTLITQIQKDEGGSEAIRKAEKAEGGSIGKILNYMLRTNKWLDHIDVPEELNRRIHLWADKVV